MDMEDAEFKILPTIGKAYTYIYKTNGTLISFEDLQQNPELIKETDLVFTNLEW